MLLVGNIPQKRGSQPFFSFLPCNVIGKIDKKEKEKIK